VTRSGLVNPITPIQPAPGLGAATNPDGANQNSARERDRAKMLGDRMLSS